MAAFSKVKESKKGKKKKKLRKKEESVLESLVADGGQAEELGSRSDRERRKQEKELEQRKETRDQFLSYQRATQKMAEESKALFGV